MKRLFFAIIIFSFCLWPFNYSAAATLDGRILLQVESHGEAWYVNPLDHERYYLGRPADAYDLMRKLGLGVSDRDFYTFSLRMPSRLAGRILLKVEDKGQAYYVNPLNLKLYYLGKPDDAFRVIRSLGLGITNNDLSKITINSLSALPDVSLVSGATPQAGEKLVKFTWKYNNKLYYLEQIYKDSLYQNYKNSPKYLSYPSNNPPADMRDAFYAMFLRPKDGDKSLDVLFEALKQLAAKDNLSDDKLLEFVMAFVQFIPYDTSKTGEIVPNYIYETLYKNSGVCSDKSFLALALLRKIGYGSVILDYPDNKHSAVGVSCPAEARNYDSGYCFIETTTYLPVGVVPQEIKNGQAVGAENQFDNIFSPAVLGATEYYQKIDGLTYYGLSQTQNTVKAIVALGENIKSEETALNTLSAEIDVIKNQLNNLLAQINLYLNQNNISEYNKLVPQYNAKAEEYNNKLANYKLKIDIYNQNVKTYNESVRSFYQK